MPEIGLQRASIDAFVGELVAAGVPEHVRVHWETEASRDAEPRDHLAKARGRERRTAFGREDKRRRRVLLALEPAQRPQLAAGQRMDGFGAALDPADMQAAVGEVDRVPAQRDQLGRPQAVPIGDQHRGGVAVAMAVLPGGSDQAGDLAVGEILARADLGIPLAARGPGRNCPNNGCWRHQREMRFCHDFSGLSSCYCPKYGPHGTLRKARNADFMGTTAISGAAAEPVGMQETLNWRAFL